LAAIAHISPDVLKENQDMIDKHVRDWYEKFGENRNLIAKTPNGIEVVPIEKAKEVKIVYPWGEDKEALVAAMAQANPNKDWWDAYDNPLVKVARREYGASTYQSTPMTLLVQAAENAWKEQKEKRAA
jgi:hypothetical protein